MDNTTDTDTTETGQEAKHDQWYAVKPCHANGWWIISRDPDGDDCVDASGDGGFNEPEAKLIAAAPDMLEALRLIEQNSANAWTRGVARAAIAKAGGKA